MKWIQERDLLVAQTMTFVQSITGTKPEALVRPETRIETAAPDKSVERAIVHRVVPVPTSPTGLREEIRRRVAAFRAHQQLFDRERDAYCDAVVTKLRASMADPKSTGD